MISIFLILGLIVPLTLVLLIVFGVASFIKKKDETNTADHLPQAVDITYYIGMFITLIATVGGLISILFAAIDYHFKDVLDLATYYSDLEVGNTVRQAVAVLFVAFPIYLILAFLQTKRIKEVADRAKLTIRSMYLYSVLLVTTITIAGNLIYVIYNFLSGEIWQRFLPKSLVLLVLALFVFGYHFYLLKRDYTTNKKYHLGFLAASIILVLASTIYGIVQTGTPSEIRARKFDDKRLQDLSQIQMLVLQKWQRDGVLPENLSELNNEIAGSVIPVDPRTKSEYEYKVIKQSELGTGLVNTYPVPMYDKAMSAPSIGIAGAKTGIVAKTDAEFELCANFETVRDILKRSTQMGGGYKGAIEPLALESSYRLDSGYYTGDNSNPTWDHKAERTCYQRTINVKQYQVYGN